MESSRIGAADWRGCDLIVGLGSNQAVETRRWQVYFTQISGSLLAKPDGPFCARPRRNLVEQDETPTVAYLIKKGWACGYTNLGNGDRQPRSDLQLVLQLVEEAPVGALGQELLGGALEHPDLV